MQGTIPMLVLFALVALSTAIEPKLIEIDGNGVQKMADKLPASSSPQQSDPKKSLAEAKTAQAKESSHTAEKPSTKSKHDVKKSDAKGQGGTHTEGNSEAAATHAKKDAKMSDAKSQGGTHTDDKPEAAATHAKQDAKMTDTKSEGGAHTEGKPVAAATSAKKDGASFMDGIVNFMTFSSAGGLFRKERKETDVPAASAVEEENVTAVPNHYKHLLEEEEEDVALDELEAMTIAAALNGKKGPPAVNCHWGDWTKDPSPDGDCTKTCGKGKQKQVRKHEPAAAHGGDECHGAATQWIACDEGDCPTTTTTTTEAPTTTTAGVPRMVDVSLLAYLAFITCAM